MQVTVQCPGCARLLTVKAEQADQVSVLCPTCGWKGTMTTDGKVIEEQDRGN